MRFQTCENNQAAKKRAQLGEEDLEDLQVRGCREQNMWCTINSAPLRCAGRLFFSGETHIFLNLRGMIWGWRYLNTWWNSSSASGATFFASVQQQHQALLECVSSAVPQVVEGKERPTHGYEKLKRFQFQNNWLSTCNHATNKRRLIGLPSTFFQGALLLLGAILPQGFVVHDSWRLGELQKSLRPGG